MVYPIVARHALLIPRKTPPPFFLGWSGRSGKSVIDLGYHNWLIDWLIDEK